MQLHFNLPVGSKTRTLRVYDHDGVERTNLSIAADTTCCTLDVLPRWRVELSDPPATAVISKSIAQGTIVTLKCPEIIVAPATPMLGKPPEPKVAPAVLTPAQRLAAGQKPVLGPDRKVIWE